MHKYNIPSKKDGGQMPSKITYIQEGTVMAFKDSMDSVKKFFQKIGKKNLVIASAVVLIGVAVLANWLIFRDNNGGYDYNGGDGMVGILDNTKDPTSGDTSNEQGTTSPDTDTSSDSYFSSIQVSRQRARDEALEVLQAVIDNASATEDVKAEAAAEISQISLEMQQEANIESILVSKGFEKCVAVISGDSANIVVKSEDGKLTPAQLAQINAVVYEQAAIEPINVSIVAKA